MPSPATSGSTMAAYADAWAGDSPLAADAVTASPYLGFGSLQPLSTRQGTWSRVFVLAATSNPEGASVQRADAGPDVAQSISTPPPRSTASVVRARSVGVVIGATVSTRPTSAHWVVRSWCLASARRGGGPRRSGGFGGEHPASCCPRCHARVLRPAQRSPPWRGGRAIRDAVRIWHDRYDVAHWTLAYPEFPATVGPPPCIGVPPDSADYCGSATRWRPPPSAGQRQFH